MLLAPLIPVTLFAFAGVLAYREREGWGWFLFFGVIMIIGASAK